MKRFIVLYHASADLMQKSMNTPPEEQAKGMEEWMKWANNCGDKLVDIGAPLTNGLRLAHHGKSKQSDKEVVGYSILQADNLEDAKKLLSGHPHLAWDASCSIEVHETMPLPGM